MIFNNWCQGVMRKNRMLMCHEKSNKIRLSFWEINVESIDLGKRNFKAEDFLVY